MAEPELSPADPALRQCKTLKALRYKVGCRYGCPEAESQNGSTGLRPSGSAMKYEIPEMLKQGGGAVVNTASTL
jgi:hypothetical protein